MSSRRHTVCGGHSSINQNEEPRGEVSESSASAGQQPADENKTEMNSKNVLKRKVSSSKKIYIHNYFIRSGTKEGDNEVDTTTPLDNPVSEVPQAPDTLLSPILEYVAVSRPTRSEHKREYRQEQELGSTRFASSFGMDSSIIEELVVLADTASDECWNNSNGENNDKDNVKKVPCGGEKIKFVPGETPV
ncbi:hypothetical protein NDU88_006381 [Pleurodeles waltl]|uniref:Uncharacterized protein n=1 Tax=Pleurodeles waltl TaxID=8319 RepID=A0AAV7PI98_PLEWA|nr:hypothetical protein NDU88_006381 [Pleurodeles waltl]